MDFSYDGSGLDQRASATVTIEDYSKLADTQATGTITITDYASMVAAAATGTIEVTDYSALVGAVVTVNGTELVEGTDWTAATDNATTAESLKDAIDALAGVGASRSTATVTITAASAGTAGNSIGMELDGTGATLSGDYLTGGLDHFTVTVDEVEYVQGTDFTAETDNDTTATNLAAAIDADDQGAAAVGAVVTVTAAAAGQAGNEIGMEVSSSDYATLSGATLTGGGDNATITLQGAALVAGTDWTAGTSNAATATSLASAMDGESGFTASATDNVVTVYWETPGTAGNAKTLVTSDETYAPVSGATLSGGVAQTYTNSMPVHEIQADEVEATLQVTAFDGDTAYTLDVTPQYSHDGDTWFDQPAGTSFTQVDQDTSLTYSESVDMATVASHVRFKIVLGGTNPLPTFTIGATAK